MREVYTMKTDAIVALIAFAGRTGLDCKSKIQ
jgi:hypothetical protein